jgi:hypothetical protein
MGSIAELLVSEVMSWPKTENAPIPLAESSFESMVMKKEN